MLLCTLLLQAGVLCLTSPFYRVVGLSIPWRSIGGQLVLPGILAAFAILTARDRNGVPQALWAVVMLLFAWLIIGPAQYFVAAWRRPLIDEWLLAADRALGINQLALVTWTNAHVVLRHALGLAYLSLLPQFFLPAAILGYSDRRELWRFVWHFHVVAIVTVVAFGLWPAGVPALHGIPEALSQREAMRQLFGVRSGTIGVIRLEEAVGLISWPSFHVAGALMVTWALRNTWCRWPVIFLNSVLAASTVLLGLHYAIDVAAAVVVCAISIAFEKILRGWIDQSTEEQGPRRCRRPNSWPHNARPGQCVLRPRG
jgi:hypothetical protein